MDTAQQTERGVWPGRRWSRITRGDNKGRRGEHTRHGGRAADGEQVEGGWIVERAKECVGYDDVKNIEELGMRRGGRFIG